MSLVDRDARVANRQRPRVQQSRISLEEFVARQRGAAVQQEAVRGEPSKPRGVTVGVPSGMPPMLPPKAPKSCSMLTKKGDPCKARPVKGTGLCVGHSRVVDDVS